MSYLAMAWCFRSIIIFINIILIVGSRSIFIVMLMNWAKPKGSAVSNSVRAINIIIIDIRNKVRVP